MSKVIAGVSWPSLAVSALADAPWPVWIATLLAPSVVQLILGLKALNKADVKHVPAVLESLFLPRPGCQEARVESEDHDQQHDHRNGGDDGEDREPPS